MTVLSKLSRWPRYEPAWGTTRKPATVPATRTPPAERTKRLKRAHVAGPAGGEQQRQRPEDVGFQQHRRHAETAEPRAVVSHQEQAGHGGSQEQQVELAGECADEERPRTEGSQHPETRRGPAELADPQAQTGSRHQHPERREDGVAPPVRKPAEGPEEEGDDGQVGELVERWLHGGVVLGRLLGRMNGRGVVRVAPVGDHLGGCIEDPPVVGQTVGRRWKHVRQGECREPRAHHQQAAEQHTSRHGSAIIGGGSGMQAPGNGTVADRGPGCVLATRWRPAQRHRDRLRRRGSMPLVPGRRPPAPVGPAPAAAAWRGPSPTRISAKPSTAPIRSGSPRIVTPSTSATAGLK